MTGLLAYSRAWTRALAALFIIFLVSGVTELIWAFCVKVYVKRRFKGVNFWAGAQELIAMDTRVNGFARA